VTDQSPGFECDATSETAPKAASNERLQQRVATAARTVRLRLGPNAIAAAQRGEPVILNMSEADDLAVAVLTELSRELDAFAEYENAINWMTTCTSCARVLDSSIRETERAERAEATVARIAALADEHPAGIDTALIHEALDQDREATAYARTVNAPPSPETCAAIKARLESGDYPQRTVRPRGHATTETATQATGGAT
jgi:regulator of sirC expression with transglutaminase-like and TPR domain